MTHAFTLGENTDYNRYVLLYGAYLQPDIPPPKTFDDYAANVAYLPYIAYPYEVVLACR
jgi:hypothetical protein